MRHSKRTEDGSPHPDMQLNVMNARVAALVAVDPDRWALAGDQLYVDLDLSVENLPPEPASPSARPSSRSPTYPIGAAPSSPTATARTPSAS